MPNDDSDLLADLLRFKPEGMTPNRWASLAGVSRTVWNDMRRHGNPARRTLEKLLGAAGSSLAEFEALRLGAHVRPGGGGGTLAEHGTGWRGAALPPVPLFDVRSAATAEQPSLIAISSERSSDAVTRPASLAADRQAYAIRVVEDSMWPRFRLGRCLIVSPAAEAEAGDDVVVRLEGGSGLALVKELVRRSAGVVELRQFNPDSTLRLPLGEVAAVEKIVGEAI